MIGQSIGNYKILEKLSQNGTVEVYKAVDVLLSCDVLIKVLDLDSTAESTMAEDFRFEAATLAKLNHSSLPALHALLENRNLLFMILEFVKGETLDKFLRRRGKISFEEAVPIFVKILDSLEYSHKSAIVHGNLKASDIILSGAETVKILGFGKPTRFQSSEMREDVSLKQSTADGNDATDDIYAVGALFFETLTGKSLLEFENGLAAEENPAEEMRKYLYSVHPFIPEEIKSAITKAVSLNRVERFQTANAFRDVLLTYGFDDLTVKKEISASENLISDALPFTRLKPFESIDNLDNSGNFFPLPLSKTDSAEENIAVYSVDFSSNEDKTGEWKSKLKWIKANRENVSQIKKPEVKNSARSRSKMAVAGILAVLVLHFVWQTYFIQSENLQIAETTIKTEESAKPIVETQPQYEAKNREPVEPEKIVQPIELSQPEIKPSKAALKKKAPVESRTERLRRVEKALTGI